MNKKFLIFAMTLASLISCTKEIGREKQPNIKKIETGINKKYQTLVKLSIPTTATKAEPTFASGNDDDNAIEAYVSFLVFYSAEKTPILTIPFNSIDWKSSSLNGKVSHIGAIDMQVPRKPKYVVCLLNCRYVYDENYTKLENLKAFSNRTQNLGQKDSLNNSVFLSYALGKRGTSYPLMTNSSYYNGDKFMQEIEILEENIIEISNDNNIPTSSVTTPKPTPIDIYVERVVSKITVDTLFNNENGITYQDGYYNVRNYFGLKIISWGLNATNKTFAPLKKLDKTVINSSFNKFTTSADILDVINWNSTENFRSYWAIDDNYEYSENGYLTNAMFEGRTIPNFDQINLNYYSLNQSNNKFKTAEKDNAEYCFENTIDYSNDLQKAFNKLTHVIIKAQYVDPTNGNTVDNVYKVNRKIYTEEELKEFILNYLKNIPGVPTDINVNSISISRNKDNYKDRTDVKGIISYQGELGSLNDKRDNLNAVVFGEGVDCWVYPQGYCYYAIPIYGFKVESSVPVSPLPGARGGGITPDRPSPDMPITMGVKRFYAGIVRNHWYNITIDDIYDFGEPADLDKPIVPEDIINKQWGISANINVLAWATSNQNEALGGGPYGLIIDPDFNPDFDPLH